MEKRFGYITPEDFKIAAENGISENLVAVRVRQLGWDIDKAISTPKKNKNKNLLWKKWKNTALQNGITYKLFYKRVFYNDVNPETAATTPPMARKDITELSMKSIQKYDPKLLEVAEKNGISKQLFYNRMHRNWDIERAITTPPISKEENVKSTNEKKREKREKGIAKDPWRKWNDSFWTKNS